MVTRKAEDVFQELEGRIREQEKLARELVERVDNVRRQIDALGETVEALRELVPKVAVLENQQQVREKRVDRYWLVIAAGVGALLTLLGQWVVNRLPK